VYISGSSAHPLISRIICTLRSGWCNERRHVCFGTTAPEDLKEQKARKHEYPYKIINQVFIVFRVVQGHERLPVLRVRSHVMVVGVRHRSRTSGEVPLVCIYRTFILNPDDLDLEAAATGTPTGSHIDRLSFRTPSPRDRDGLRHPFRVEMKSEIVNRSKFRWITEGNSTQIPNLSTRGPNLHLRFLKGLRCPALSICMVR
jgi:hypothetical protein